MQFPKFPRKGIVSVCPSKCWNSTQPISLPLALEYLSLNIKFLQSCAGLCTIDRDTSPLFWQDLVALLHAIRQYTVVLLYNAHRIRLVSGQPTSDHSPNKYHSYRVFPSVSVHCICISAYKSVRTTTKKNKNHDSQLISLTLRVACNLDNKHDAN